MKKVLDIFKDAPQQDWVRKPRIKTDYLKKISFKIPAIEFKNDFMVTLENISTSGVAFSFIGKNTDFNVHDIIEVNFEIYEHPCSVNIEVVRIEDDVIGARIISNIAEFNQLVCKFYKIELSAAEMSHVDSKRLNPKKHGDPHWYHGDNNCELYFVERNERIINFHITYFGNAIEYGQTGKFVFGHIWEEEREKDIHFKGSHLIKIVDSMEFEIVEESKSFIRQIPLLDDHYKQQIIEIIDSHAKDKVA